MQLLTRITSSLLISALFLALFVFLPETSCAYTTSKTLHQITDGQILTFSFTNLPKTAHGVTVTITLYGDYDHSSEYADVWIDGTSVPRHDGGGQCTVGGHSKDYGVTNSYLDDDALTVVIDLSAAVGITSCDENKVEVTLTYTAYPDLTVTYSQAPFTGNTNGSGSTFTVRYRLQNSTEGFTTDFYTGFYLCLGPSSSDCSYLGRQYITADFATSGSGLFVSPTLTLPPTARSGTRYVRIKADYTSMITEQNDDNNERYDPVTIIELPDLSIINPIVPFTGNTDKIGSQFTAQYTVINNGLSAVAPGYRVRFYYCPDQTGMACYFLDDQLVNYPLYSGYTRTLTSPTLTMHTSAEYGTQYLRIFADYNDIVGEANENNNNIYAPIHLSYPWPIFLPAILEGSQR